MEEGGHCACPEWADERMEAEDCPEFHYDVWEKMCADPSYHPCYDCEFFTEDE